MGKETGKAGESYNGGRDFSSMKQFVIDKLDNACDIEAIDTCTPRETKYYEKMVGKGRKSVLQQLDRLRGMTNKVMKAELMKWVMQRINILEQMEEATKDEL